MMWSARRPIWAFITIVSVGLVMLAHFGFQEWLFMHPCEQCVYVRFAFVVMALGSLVAFMAPQVRLLRLLGMGLGVAGALYGLMKSWMLERVHQAVHSDDISAMFGLQGCSMEPHFPFDLPLASWMPNLFGPTGDCGYDTPVVPPGVEVHGLQATLIEMYQEAGSWYLVPSLKFLDMAQCCLIAFGVALAIYLSMMVLEVKKR